MKTLKEISEQIRKNINEFLEVVDGAESVLEKAVVDMKVRLNEAKDLVGAAIAEEERLKRAYRETVSTANMWGEKADAALQNRDIALASEAQQLKRYHLNVADGYKHQIAVQTKIVTSLKTALHKFHQQFQNAAGHAETLSYRQKRAETRAGLYELIAAENGISTALAQAERKLKTTEEKAEIWENRNHRDAADVKKDVEISNLDKSLAELKRDILGDRCQ